MKAIVFIRNCGATTGYSTQVSLMSAGTRLPNDGGNVFVSDGVVPLTIRWTSDYALEIGRVGTERIFRQEQAVDGVVISYAKNAL